MSHSAELIQSVRRLLENDYPAHQYKYTIESAIPGTRMMPDIQVRDALGSLVCVTEIGYTRPEKLTAYRKQLKIPDVRWYDKAGNLHADVEERVIRVSIQQQPVGFFAVYRIYDMVECRNESCESIAMVECDLTVKELEGPEPLSDEVCEKAWEVSNCMCMDVTTVVVTDYARVWFICYCDKCGDTWDAATGSSMDLQGIAYDLESMNAGEFARSWGARQFHGDWVGAATWVFNYLGVEPEYKAGEFLSVRLEREFNRSMAAVRMEAIRI